MRTLSFATQILHHASLVGFLVAVSVIPRALSAAEDGTSQDEAAAINTALDVEKYTLSNGLEVILAPDSSTDFVTLNVTYAAGIIAEPADHKGLVRTLERAMLLGSKNLEPLEVLTELELAGALSAYTLTRTDLDLFQNSQTLPANELARALWLESERMSNLKSGFTQPLFDFVRSELKKTVPPNVEWWRMLFPKTHPYRARFFSKSEMDQNVLADVRAFYDDHFAPSNATLLIAGRLSPLTKKWVEKYFGSLAKWPTPPVLNIDRPTLNKRVRHDVEHAGAEGRTQLVVAHFSPHYFEDGDAELTVLAEALAAERSSILHRDLIDPGLALTVSAAQLSFERVGVFYIEAWLDPTQDVGAALSIIEDSLDLLPDLPLTEDRVQRVKARLRKQSLLDLESSWGRASRVQRYNHQLNRPSALAEDLQRLKNVTSERISAQAKIFLLSEQRFVYIARPKNITDAGEAP